MLGQEAMDMCSKIWRAAGDGDNLNDPFPPLWLPSLPPPPVPSLCPCPRYGHLWSSAAVLLDPPMGFPSPRYRSPAPSQSKQFGVNWELLTP